MIFLTEQNFAKHPGWDALWKTFDPSEYFLPRVSFRCPWIHSMLYVGGLIVSSAIATNILANPGNLMAVKPLQDVNNMDNALARFGDPEEVDEAIV